MSETQSSYAIIGGGISGLAAAFYLQKQKPESLITVYESQPRLGGVLKTVRHGDFLVEASADMFVTQPPEAMDLCRELGMESNLLQTQPVDDRAFIGLAKDLFPVPKGLSMMVPTDPQPILESDLLSEQGKQRFLAEGEVEAATSTDDESLKSFAVRRFGVEAYEKIIQPMVSGIYTADPDKLSMHATMQRFVDMERAHGSLITALEKNRNEGDAQASGARYGLFRTPSGGMETLIKSIVSALPRVKFKTNAMVSRVAPKHSPARGVGWSVDEEFFDGVVLAVPAAASATMIVDTDAQLADALSGITTASSAIVVLGVSRADLKKDFQGYGIIYPHVDQGQVIALSFSSNKFAGRCKEDEVLIRCFIGGAMQSALVDLKDEQLLEIAMSQLNTSVGLSGDPIFTDVFRWKHCMPQYHLGHLDRVNEIERQVGQHPGLELAGNSYWGVGVPACIASGKAAAARLAGSADFAGQK
jgi:oxygen-dependent protoporphyrinogen oxidase